MLDRQLHAQQKGEQHPALKHAYGALLCQGVWIEVGVVHILAERGVVQSESEARIPFLNDHDVRQWVEAIRVSV